MTNCLLFTVMCVFGCVMWSVGAINSLHLLTNSLDEDILNYYSDLPDRITDVALEGIRKYLLDHNETRIDIPTVEVKFDIPYLGNVGEFKGTDGYFQNPATVVRTKNTVIHWGMKSNATTAVGFTFMEVYFPRYSTTAIGITETGDARVTIGRNEILLEAQIVIFPKCTIELSRVQLTTMEDIVADITGLGLLNWLVDDIVGFVLASYQTSITEIIEKVVTDELVRVMAKTNGKCKVRRRATGDSKVAAMGRKVHCQTDTKSRFYCHVING